MAITVNKNTTQQPITSGLTGTQSIKFIDAPRFYVKAADSLTAAPVTSYFAKSNGATPTGWTDLGVVDGKCKIGVQKKTKEVKTGIDNYFRAAYTSEKVGTIECSLTQFDYTVFQNISGISPYTVTSGSTYSFAVGSEDLNQVAVLLVIQNKLDGKEWQFYNPAAYLNYSIDEQGDELVVKVSGMLPFFLAAVNGTSEAMIQQTIFA